MSSCALFKIEYELLPFIDESANNITLSSVDKMLSTFISASILAKLTTPFACALTVPSILTLTDLFKFLDDESIPVQALPTQPPPTCSPIAPFFAFITRLPPFVTNWVFVVPLFITLPFSKFTLILP